MKIKTDFDYRTEFHEIIERLEDELYEHLLHFNIAEDDEDFIAGRLWRAWHQLRNCALLLRQLRKMGD